MRKMPFFLTRFALATAVVAASSGSAHAANSIIVPKGPGNECASSASSNTTSAHYAGSCGSLATVDPGDTTATYVQDNSPAGEGAPPNSYNVRFYVNLRGMTTGNGGGAGVPSGALGGESDVFVAYDNDGGADPAAGVAAGTAALRLVVGPNGSAPNKPVAHLVAVDDAGNPFASTTVPFRKGWRDVEIHYQKAATAVSNDGSVLWWIDGVAQPSITSLDNTARGIDYVRWGAITIAGGAHGTFKLDDFASQRSGNIKPAQPLDVTPSDPQWKSIMGMYGGDVMAPTSVGVFSATSLLTRGLMAQLIMQGRFGANYIGTCSCGSGGVNCFDDVVCGTTPNANFIYDLVRYGIASASGSPGGCADPNGPGTGTNLTYCPNNNITRGEMSPFIMQARADLGPFPACPNPSPFTDLAFNSSFCPFVKAMVDFTITAGCGAPNGSGQIPYCPNTAVTRGEMAVFLHQAFQTVNPEVLGPTNAP